MVANLGVADAILYKGFQEILYRPGNINDSFAAIDALADNGHFMSMIARFIVTICQHPYYKNGLVPNFNHI